MANLKALNALDKLGNKFNQLPKFGKIAVMIGATIMSATIAVSSNQAQKPTIIERYVFTEVEEAAIRTAKDHNFWAIEGIDEKIMVEQMYRDCKVVAEFGELQAEQLMVIVANRNNISAETMRAIWVGARDTGLCLEPARTTPVQLIREMSNANTAQPMDEEWSGSKVSVDSVAFKSMYQVEKLGKNVVDLLTPPPQPTFIFETNTEILPQKAEPAFVSYTNVVTLVARDANAQINLRQSPDTGSALLGYGVPNDRVKLLEKVAGSDGNLWYKVEFPGSAAVGFVRGDFVRE